MKTHKRFHLKSVVMLMTIPLLLITIVPALTALADGGSSFIEHTIEDRFVGASFVYATDLDGDEDVDILGAADDADDIAWWENDGDENFTRHTIATYFYGAQSVYATDLDSDGDIDVLGAAYTADDITWWENDGDENFTEHTIADNFDGARSVYATDVNSDGDVDVLGTAGYADDITWWENDGSENFTEHTIADNFDDARSVYATDVDGDGDVDVLGAAYNADDITWWENDGDENFVEHTIDGNFSGARSVYATDLDNDGDNDVFGAARGAQDITWWENDGSGNFTAHTIDGDFRGACSVYTSDLDNDGDIDVLGAGSGVSTYDGYITWWEQRPALSISNTSVTEGDSGSVSAVFSVTLSITSTQAITIEYATADDSAVAPADYTAIPGTTLVFPPGVSTQFINVSVQGDTIDEPDETFWVNLANPVNASLGDAQGQGTIIDDDLATISFSSATYRVNEDAGQATITVTLGAASDITVTVNYTASDGAAISGMGKGWTYILQEDATSTFSSPETRYIGPDASWSASGQTEGTYYYRVRAGNSMGDSAWSNVLSVTVGPPDTPVLNPINNPDGYGYYAVSWIQATGALTYTLQEDDDPGFSSPEEVYSGSRTSKQICDRDAGTYYYRVKASNAMGSSGWSNVEAVEATSLCSVSCSTPSGYCTGSWTVSISCESGSYSTSSSCYNCSIGGIIGTCCNATRTYNSSGRTYNIFAYSYNSTGYPNCRLSASVSGGVFGGCVGSCRNYSLAGQCASSNTAISACGATEGACDVNGAGEAMGTFHQMGTDFSGANGDWNLPRLNVPQRIIQGADFSVVNSDWSRIRFAALQPPDAPVLDPISNPDRDGNYMVNWMGGDYTAVSGTLTFTPGEATYTFTIPIADDTLDENDETIILSLSNPDNGTLLIPTLATLTIVDDDPPPTVQFSSATYNMYEDAGSATITATLNAASGLTVTVGYAASDGTATAPADYTAVSGTLTFSPGQTSRSFAVPIFSDTLDEEDETVNLDLSNPDNAALGIPSTATLTILDATLPPVADFTAAPLAGQSPLTVVFTDISNGAIATWQWSFGDGETSAAQHPIHTYTLTGTFTVSLTVSGPDGSDTEVKAGYIQVSEKAIVASFTAHPTSGPVPLTVQFSDESAGDVTSWQWDFGDKVTSTLPNPTHTYSVEGVYTVTLTVSGLDGSDTLTRPGLITVDAPVQAGFTIYLPLVLKNARPPLSPTLNDIHNPDGLYDYTVSWSAVSGATGYTLEEDEDATFSSPIPVYSGPDISKPITGQEIGTYYYRVQAWNSFGSSDWSTQVGPSDRSTGAAASAGARRHRQPRWYGELYDRLEHSAQGNRLRVGRRRYS